LEIGPAGMFGAYMIEDVLRKADEAAISGSLVDMIASLRELKEVK